MDSARIVHEANVLWIQCIHIDLFRFVIFVANVHIIRSGKRLLTKMQLTIFFHSYRRELNIMLNHPIPVKMLSLKWLISLCWKFQWFGLHWFGFRRTNNGTDAQFHSTLCNNFHCMLNSPQIIIVRTRIIALVHKMFYSIFESFQLVTIRQNFL